MNLRPPGPEPVFQSFENREGWKRFGINNLHLSASASLKPRVSAALRIALTAVSIALLAFSYNQYDNRKIDMVCQEAGPSIQLQWILARAVSLRTEHNIEYCL